MKRMAMGGALLLFAGCAGGGAAAQSVILKGPGGEIRTLTAAQLAAMPHQSAQLAPEGGGAPRAYEGVPLSDLLQSVGAPSGHALRGPAMADIVVVGAADGYRVAFSLAEMDAGVRGERIILADRTGGMSLAPAEGPLRLVVEGDLRPARSVRSVTSITLEAAP
jgi:hypothetical protein